MSLADQIRRLDLSVLGHVESQTTEDDRKSLLALHAAIADSLGTFRYLEIGSHLGGSLQSFVADPTCVGITSIDPRPAVQPDDRGTMWPYPDNSTERMMKLLSQVPGAELTKLTSVEKSTSQVDPALLPRPQLCLVDGEHTAQAALRDALFCRDVMRGHGIVVFHDRSIVEPAIHAFLAEIGRPYRAYPLRTEFFVVELGHLSLLRHRLVRSRLEPPSTAWLTMNRFALPRLLLNPRVRRLSSFSERVKVRASSWRSRVPARIGTAEVATDTTYDATYFTELDPGSVRSAAKVAPLVQELVRATSVVDVGCGTGAWLAAFGHLGVEDLMGVDGEYARTFSSQRLPHYSFAAADLARPLGVTRRFDLAVCLEVAEHLPRERAAGLVEDLTRLAPVVFFSAAIPCQGGTDHVSEAWPGWWSDLFSRHGYVRRDVLRHLLWEDDDVEPWYAQNAFLYVREAALDSLPSLSQAPESGYPLRAVHPRLFTARVEMLEHLHRQSQTVSAPLRALRRISPPPNG